MKTNRVLYLLFILIVSGTSMASMLYARPYGRTGRSGKQGGTCSNCHFGTDSPELELTAPNNILPGETVDLVFTVRRTSTNPDVTTAGFNVATDAGTIIGRGESPEACTDLDEPDNSNVTCIDTFEGDLEIAHARPAVLQDGEMSFEFSWTAPITPGDYTLYGAGVTAVSGAGAFNTNVHGAATTATLTVAEEAAVGFLGDPNCDGTMNAVDALAVLQFDVSLRTDAGQCPLSDSATQLHAAAGNVNSDNASNSVDSLIIMQCEVGIANDFCTAP